MSNVIEIFLKKTLDSFILAMAKNIKEKSEIIEEEKKHKKLKEGSIPVEFKVIKEVKKEK